jgi:glucose-6-phosphate dehydrogenase assembly protein OpcA
MQIQLEKTLDVEVVERQLAELWKDTAREPNEDTAVLRARVANLLVFVSDQTAFDEVEQLLRELTAVHPSRVLMMLADQKAVEHDIEMSVESICQTDKRTGVRRLCCEEIALVASGKFVVELPSAALPLLVPDLSTFLWWRNAPMLSDKVLDTLLRATDRLVIDSAGFADPPRDLNAMNSLFNANNYDHVGISDLNWARLTFWRELLADFYDVAAYRPWLDKIDFVEIDYVAPDLTETFVAPQAWLISAWLATRLGWKLAEESTVQQDETVSFKFLRNGQDSNERGRLESGVITVKLNRVGAENRMPGRLVRVEMKSNFEEGGSFKVARSEDNLHLLAESQLGNDSHRGRVLPVRNRSAAQLLSREMEILCNDKIYQEAISLFSRLFTHFDGAV